MKPHHRVALDFIREHGRGVVMVRPADAMTMSLAAATLALACCKHPGATPPRPVAPPADSSAVALACFNLRVADCPEGDPADGGDSCEQLLARDDPRLGFDVKCLSESHGAEQLRACGHVRCARP